MLHLYYVEYVAACEAAIEDARMTIMLKVVLDCSPSFVLILTASRPEFGLL